VPRLSCRELGGDCDFVACAGTKDEVKSELLAHVAEAHGQRVRRMSSDEREALDVRIDQMLRRYDAGDGWR
jgi:predicted small metal-binding protein